MVSTASIQGETKQRTTPCNSARNLWIAVAIFAVTLALRLTFLWRSPDAAWPHSILYEGDAPVWARWAALLRAGQPFEDDLAFRTPGVAFPLAWLGLTAAPFTAAKVLWCVLSALTPAVLYLMMARWFSRAAGAVAAALVVTGFGSFVIATSLNNEAPYALLLTLLAWGTLEWVHQPRAWWTISLGVAHGAAMLLRAEHLALLWMTLAFMGWRWWRSAPRAPRGPLQLLAVPVLAVLTCLPWALRSHAAAVRFNTQAPAVPYESARPRWTPEAVAALEALPAFARAPNFAFITHQALAAGLPAVDAPDVHAFFEREWNCTPEPVATWCLVSFKGPLDFALSNDPRSDGGFSRVALSDSHDRDPPFHLARPSHLWLVNHGWSVGLDSITGNPRRWLDLEWEKLRRFGDGITLGLFPSDWPHAPRMLRRPIDVATPRRGDSLTWNTAMLGMLAVGAAVSARTRGGGLWLLMLGYRVLVVLLFYGYARHAVSIGPVTAAITGLGVVWAARLAMARWTVIHRAAPWIGAATLAAMLAACAWSCWNPPTLRARPALIGDRVNPAPEWGEGAFEAVDAVALEPFAR